LVVGAPVVGALMVEASVIGAQVVEASVIGAQVVGGFMDGRLRPRAWTLAASAGTAEG